MSGLRFLLNPSSRGVSASVLSAMGKLQIVGNKHSLPLSTLPSHYATTTIQTRSKMTKAKKKRLAQRRKKSGTYTRPDNYVDVRNTPIIESFMLDRPNAYERLDDSSRLSKYLPKRQEEEQKKTTPLRHEMSSLEGEMSPKVKQLFQLSNGSAYERAKAQKEHAIKLFQLRDGDTGSSAVQIVALTSRIQQVQNHVRVHKKDHSGKRGLTALYVRRRKMLDYLERTDFDTYRVVVKALGLA